MAGILVVGLMILDGVGNPTLGRDITLEIEKETIQVVETECFVVATQAKLIAPPFSDPVAYARELWSRTSENESGRFVTVVFLGVEITVDLFALFSITPDRDALGNRTPKSGLGWKPDFLDTLSPAANQRHHFAFHFFVGSFGSRGNVVAEFGQLVNVIADASSNNIGDLRLSGAAENLGQITQGKSTILLVGERVKTGFCRPAAEIP